MAYSLDDEWENGPMIRRAGVAAFGLYCACGLWVARHLTDGFVPADVAASYGTREWAAKLVDAGFWRVVEGGYHMPHYLDRNPSAEQVRKRRRSAARRQALVRDPVLREMVRTRDKDRCRYCGIAVRWSDRKGAKGGTYDHVDPDGPNTPENVVVCCRGCNSSKCDRPLAETGMTLRPAPGSDLGQTQDVSRSDPVSSRPHSPSLKGGRGRDLRAVPAWCGRCNKNTRMGVDDRTDEFIECPNCHPNREAS